MCEIPIIHACTHFQIHGQASQPAQKHSQLNFTTA